MNKQTEAIQQAIDFLDGSYKAHAVRKALQEALAQPAQEPTCWITAHGEGFRIRFEKPDNGVPLGWMELYEHPAPAREWVGLSDDEILIICRKLAATLPNKEIDFAFARAVEEVLKEKNYD